MLVLSRQRDESLIITDSAGLEIAVEIVDIRGDKVRVGITAPKHLAVHRKEVHEAIKREQAAAARVDAVRVPTATVAGKPIVAGVRATE